MGLRPPALRTPDQRYRIGRILKDRERATAGVEKVRTLDQKGRDSLARLEKWIARLIDEHGVELDDDVIRTRAVYLATQEIAKESRQGAPALDPKEEACC